MTVWKLVDALGEWRDDAPCSLPRCCLCAAVIQIGDPHALGPALAIACCPCAGLEPPAKPKRQARPIGLLDRGFARSAE